jgi:hypothetical protein
LIDSDVLQSLNTSGALVTDEDPVARIANLAERCKSRDRSAVVISNNNMLSGSSEFFVLPFHISGSSFSILPKHQSSTSCTIDSILMPSRSQVFCPSNITRCSFNPLIFVQPLQTRLSVFASSPIVVSSKRGPATPMLTPKSSLSGTTSHLQDHSSGSKRCFPHRSSSSCKIKAPVQQIALSVLPISFGKDALDLVCDPSVWF